MENGPPEANSDRFAAAPAAKLAIPSPGVLRNDTDPNGDDLRVTPTLLSRPSNGTLTLDADGSFEYRSNQGFTGEDQFTYEVVDGNGDSAQATVTIPVQAAEFDVDIDPIVGSCAGARCHVQERTSGVRLSSRDHVLSSKGMQYGKRIVTPGKASRAASPLVDKILPDPKFGSRMPLGGPTLTDGQIDEIRAWIEGLAPDK